MCLAVPGEVVALLPDNTARARFGETEITISLAFVDDVQCGDYVLAHSGFAITVLDRDEAAAQLALWREYDDVMRAERAAETLS